MCEHLDIGWVIILPQPGALVSLAQRAAQC
jgi:hypothetical protein